mmetsp:Transcript_39667/g.92723  ORF Transcript_39667/g.92723 Transcript_39667/m.92723 type:complete len:242 (-) Transcript_39667:386-1111(-)
MAPLAAATDGPVLAIGEVLVRAAGKGSPLRPMQPRDSTVHTPHIQPPSTTASIYLSRTGSMPGTRRPRLQARPRERTSHRRRSLSRRRSLPSAPAPPTRHRSASGSSGVRSLTAPAHLHGGANSRLAATGTVVGAEAPWAVAMAVVTAAGRTLAAMGLVAMSPRWRGVSAETSSQSGGETSARSCAPRSAPPRTPRRAIGRAIGRAGRRRRVAPPDTEGPTLMGVSFVRADEVFTDSCQAA